MLISNEYKNLNLKKTDMNFNNLAFSHPVALIIFISTKSLLTKIPNLGIAIQD